MPYAFEILNLFQKQRHSGFDIVDRCLHYEVGLGDSHPAISEHLNLASLLGRRHQGNFAR